MSYQRIALDKFSDTFSVTIELSSEVIGGQVVSVSDEFFAEAFHLLLQEPASSLKGQFGPKGALYSGWESRRHNPAYDWCIIRLGTTGSITGFDVDTSHFNGNEAPQVSIDVLHGLASENPSHHDTRWTEVLPKVDLGPNSRHLFTITATHPVNYVKLNMYPDGGIARFRVYGHVSPVIPSNESELFDLAHVFTGGRVEYTSDQHFGVGANLIVPGRGKNMGGGWETKRSRTKGHKDWAIIKLGVPGVLEYVEVDTHHFKGNFPESCEVHGLYTDTSIDRKTFDRKEGWTLILPRTKLGPHRQHYFQFENVGGKIYSHVKVTIYPDGGLQRIRIMGCRSGTNRSEGIMSSTSAPPKPQQSIEAIPALLSSTKIVPVLPLTPEGFAPFGKVIQGYTDLHAVPKGTKVTPANAGSAHKFHKLSLIESFYPAEAGASSAISLYRCQPCQCITNDGYLDLKVLERHPLTNQAFIPMGSGTGEGIRDPGPKYLVVVAHNGADDHPDLGTLRAFVASAAQGIVYNTAIWHQPMTVLGKELDLACVEAQIGDGSTADCEIVKLAEKDIVRLRLATFENCECH